MKITVAISAYNAAEYLREAIESVLAQTVQPFEIVVNQVDKETISGYLSAPKVELSRK